jgi:hypothetical protein
MNMEPWVTIVVVGVAIIAVALMKPNKALPRSGSAISDIESTLDQFAEELEQDNQELIQLIAGLKRELEADINKLNGRMDALEKLGFHTPTPSQPTQAAQEPSRSVAPLPLSPLSTTEPEPVETSESVIKASSIQQRYAPILKLHEQGKSIEYIAKKNNLNKGEVQLIIQLAKQEEKFRD